VNADMCGKSLSAGEIMSVLTCKGHWRW